MLPDLTLLQMYNGPKSQGPVTVTNVLHSLIHFQTETTEFSSYG